MVPFFALALILTSHASAADTEPGLVTLPELVARAEKGNPDLVEADREADRAQAVKRAEFSPFLPELGLSSGWESWNAPSSNELGFSGGGVYAFGRWNLFRGTRDYRALQSRSAEAQFARFAADRLRATVQRQVSALFFELLYLQRATVVKKEALALNASQTDLAERRVRAGLVSDADILEFTFRRAAMDADLTLYKQQRESASAELLRWTGEAPAVPGSPPPLAVAGEFPLAPVTLNPEQALDTARAYQTELREAETQVEVARFQHQATLGEFLPTLDLEANYGTLLPSERELSGNLSSMIQIQLRIPLFSGFRAVNDRAAQAQNVQKAESRLRRVNLELRARIESSLARLRALKTRIGLEEKNVERAEKYYEITLQEYRRGVKNSPDLAGASDRLYDAKLKLIELQRDTALAKVELAEAMGTDLTVTEAAQP